VEIFHGGTRREGARVLTSGGRVLTVSAWGNDLQRAFDTAYAAVGHIRIARSFFRSDIGRRHLGIHPERTKP